MRIYKYELNACSSHELSINDNHCILDVQLVNDKIVMWAHVDQTAPYITVNILMFGTGTQDTPNLDDIYIGTLVTSTGITLHIYIRY